MTDKRDSFIFYRSFFEAISDLPKNKRLEVYEAIAELSLNFHEEDLKGLPNTIFTLIKPQLSANNRKYINGCKGGEHGHKGGRPIKPLDEPQNNPTVTPNVNVNENDNVNVKDNEHYLRDSSTFQEGTLRTLHIDLKEYLRHLDIFCIPNDMGREEAELKQHFFNWLKKQDLISNQKKPIEPYG